MVWLPEAHPGGAVLSPDGERFYLAALPPSPFEDGAYLMSHISSPSFFRGEELTQTRLLPFARVIGEVHEVVLTCTTEAGEEVREGPLPELLRR